jgi:hypothetical protein
MSDDGSLCFAEPDRSMTDPPDRNRRLHTSAVLIERELRCGRDDREIRGPPAELDESGSRFCTSYRKIDAGENFISRQSHAQITRRELAKRQHPRSRASRYAQLRVKRQRGDRQLGARVEMTKAATDGAAVACLLMADMIDRLREQRAVLTHDIGSLDGTLRRHCPN